MSWFLIEIGFICNIFKILLNGSSGFPGARLFETCQHLGFPKFRDLQKQYCWNAPGIFSICFRYPDVSKDKSSCLWDTSTIPEIIEMRSLRFSDNEIEFLLIQIGAFRPIFSKKKYHKNDPTIANESFKFSYDFLGWWLLMTQQVFYDFLGFLRLHTKWASKCSWSGCPNCRPCHPTISSPRKQKIRENR